MMLTKDKEFLINYIDYVSKKYYQGDPIITDEEFDHLVKQVGQDYVGYKVNPKDCLKHYQRMYSLQKVFEGEDNPPQYTSPTVRTLKLDGAAIALIYVQGTLSRILTRGDGIYGEDISHLIPVFPVPMYIATEETIVQITGELVAPKSIKNARNYASGALGLKNPSEFATREVEFFAYGIYPEPSECFRLDMGYLLRIGFNNVLNSDDSWPTDGIVLRIDNHKEFRKAGFTSKHPKGAYALKVRKEGIVTTLLDVIWDVGRSGVVTPVAILEPIEIDDAKVSRATLHNYKHIKDLDLEIGCEVEVIRSGDIIPSVIRRVKK